MKRAHDDGTPERHLHLSCLYGVGGDMILSALVDLGADPGHIERELRRLDVGIDRLIFSEVMRAGMRGMYLTITESGGLCDRTVLDRVGDDGGVCTHAHASHHHHDHKHAHGEHHHRHPAQGPHRHLKDMLEIVNRSHAGPLVKERAARTLCLLAEAEGRIHGRPPTEVHFHEISGIDTIVDVLGTCMAVQMLNIATMSASPVTTGRGTVHCAHGEFTVPAPATLEIIAKAGIPCQPGDMEAELLTPTGAALLAVLVDGFGPMPAMRPEKTGYGAGSYECHGKPNLLQATIGHRVTMIP